MLRHEVGETRVWPYILLGYAVLALLAPWVTSRPSKQEFNLVFSGFLVIFFALPAALSAFWLTHTPYHAIGLCLWGLAGLSIVHLLISIAFKVRGN